MAVIVIYLQKGDALGGQARNLAGALGDRKFFRTVLSVLKLAGLSYRYRDADSGAWVEQVDEDSGVEKRIKALFWKRGKHSRLLVKNSKLPLIGKNVDLMLFAASWEDYLNTDRRLFLLNDSYLALGELKGGIDPAGSDEHWKTAKSALNDIRRGFSGLGLNPPTFFVGAAIEPRIADGL